MYNSGKRKEPVMQCGSRRLSLAAPLVMGILNTTPDSFYEASRVNSVDVALQRIAQMQADGAQIIDVGGESTRPGSDPVTLDEELRRVVPVLQAAIPQFPDMLFSVDTTRYAVALEAVKAGVHIINDVSGLQKEPRFLDLCAEFGTALVIMHAKGDPKTMQDAPHYEDVVGEVVAFLDHQVSMARRAGVETVIVDPGIGFGKTRDHNVELLMQLQVFRRWGAPLLVGVSRKSLIGNLLGGREADGRLAGTLAVHYDAMVRGANIIRVHDIQEAKDSVLVYTALRKSLPYR